MNLKQLWQLLERISGFKMKKKKEKKMKIVKCLK